MKFCEYLREYAMEIINFKWKKAMQLTKEQRELHENKYMNETTFIILSYKNWRTNLKDNLILQEKMLRNTKPFHFQWKQKLETLIKIVKKI